MLTKEQHYLYDFLTCSGKGFRVKEGKWLKVQTRTTDMYKKLHHFKMEE